MSSAPATASGTIEQSEGDAGVPTGPLAATPSISTAEAARVGGSPAFLDPYMMLHFIFMTAFSWTSDMKPGTILWKTPLSPLFMNWYIRYQSKVRNLWKGTFDFRLLMAGTGFNGGKLMFFWCPPNYDISTFGLEKASTFAHMEIDPKMNEGITITGKDFCLQKAHIVRIADRAPDYADNDVISEYARIGGWLGVMVINPLINASETKTAVNISLFNKAGPDFALFEVVPPPDNLSPVFELPDIKFPKFNRHPQCSAINLTELHVSTKTSTYGIDTANLFNIETGFYSRFIGKDRISAFNVPHGNGWPWKVDSTNALSHEDPNLPGLTSFTCRGMAASTQSGVFPSEFQAYFHGPHEYSSPTIKYVQRFVPLSGFLKSAQGNVFMGFNETTISDSLIPGKFVVPSIPSSWGGVVPKVYLVESDIGESIVTFNLVNDEDGCGLNMLPYIKDYLKIAGSNFSADPIFTLRSISSKLPLFYLRLNPEGYFTSNYTDKIKSVKLKDVYLKFENFLSHNSPLPEVTPTNYFMYSRSEDENKIEDLSLKCDALLQLVQDLSRNEIDDASETSDSPSWEELPGEETSTEEPREGDRRSPAERLGNLFRRSHHKQSSRSTRRKEAD